MLNKPANWDTLWNDPESRLELKITIQLCSEIAATYGNDRLSKCTVSASVFQDLSIGNACSARLVFTLKDAENEFAQFSKEQKITLQCRLQGMSNGEPTSVVTTWVNQGIFFIDSVSKTSSGNVTITAYDSLYMLENAVSQQDAAMSLSAYMQKIGQMYPDIIPSAYTYFYNAVLYDGSIARNIEISENAAYLPAREVMASVAGFAGGNIYLSKLNSCRFLRPQIEPTTTKNSYEGELITVTSLDHDRLPQYITGVTVNQQGGVASGSGWRIIANIDESVISANDFSIDSNIAYHVNRNMKTNATSGEHWENTTGTKVEAQGVYISPLFELGDIVSVYVGNNKYYNFPILDYSVDYVGGCWGSLNCPKTDKAVEFSIEQVWHSSTGWTDGWLPTHFDTGYADCGFTAIAKNMMVCNTATLEYRETSGYAVHGNNTIVDMYSGIEELTGSFSYYGTGGQYKTVRVTMYPMSTIFPVKKRLKVGDSLRFAATRMYFYCDELPDDMIDQPLTGHITLKNETSSATGQLVYLSRSI